MPTDRVTKGKDYAYAKVEVGQALMRVVKRHQSDAIVDAVLDAESHAVASWRILTCLVVQVRVEGSGRIAMEFAPT